LPARADMSKRRNVVSVLGWSARNVVLVPPAVEDWFDEAVYVSATGFKTTVLVVGAVVGVLVGGTGVAVGGTGVAGTGVAVAEAGVAVGGTAVALGVLVAGTGVAVAVFAGGADTADDAVPGGRIFPVIEPNWFDA
jgi:hypothetical protein